MSIFKTKGFDSIISKGMVFDGNIQVLGHLVIDGTFNGKSIIQVKRSDGEAPRASVTVNGDVFCEVIEANDLTVNGQVSVREVSAEGHLTVKGTLRATTINYSTLTILPGATVTGNLKRIDESNQE
jgi:cytoskeletal protein CcmA (bactofilin family)